MMKPIQSIHLAEVLHVDFDLMEDWDRIGHRISNDLQGLCGLCMYCNRDEETGWDCSMCEKNYKGTDEWTDNDPRYYLVIDKNYRTLEELDRRYGK